MIFQPPASLLPALFREGFSEEIPPSSRDREGDSFQFISPHEVQDWLSDSGLIVEDQMIAAPMTGGYPELVSDITHGRPEELERLLHWELFAGRRRDVLGNGGHALTAARAT